ncbi:chromate transporter [Pelosinus propionicus]|uniref:Chromate transporter n=1 Tax=Pelosinus propionicus DSM 13327 TaxID=1123291 RepID=A0A1I4M3X2_9FIRM|nr:chromate transporter [Pelosinus propionicus]SFL97900.1 chromate transporter [Pelosinus propionicus DSM 13327]
MSFELLMVFLKLSLLGFGGGYAIIPLVMDEVEAHNWASADKMADTVAIAAMSPGPVAANVAIGLGLLLNGLPGIIAAFAGTTIPCVVVVWAVAAFFKKASSHPVVQDILYGLKSVIPGIIFFAALKMGMQNNMFLASKPITTGWDVIIGSSHFDGKSVIIIGIIMVMLTKTKVHPILLIIASAVAGILMF